MVKYEIAHLRQQGQDMILVPVDQSFGAKSPDDQRSMLETLQRQAKLSGLAGSVVAIWDTGDGRMAFLGPKPWASYLSSLNLEFVDRNLNKVLEID
jgi:hypothetical protein